jgi:hypothetical protein
VSHMGVGSSEVNMSNACISLLICFPMAASFQLSAAKVAMCSSIDELSVYFCFIMLLRVKNTISLGLVPWCTLSSFSQASLAKISSVIRSSFSFLTYSIMIPSALSFQIFQVSGEVLDAVEGVDSDGAAVGVGSVEIDIVVVTAGCCTAIAALANGAKGLGSSPEMVPQTFLVFRFSMLDSYAQKEWAHWLMLIQCPLWVIKDWSSTSGSQFY